MFLVQVVQRIVIEFLCKGGVKGPSNHQRHQLQYAESFMSQSWLFERYKSLGDRQVHKSRLATVGKNETATWVSGLARSNSAYNVTAVLLMFSCDP